MTTIPGFSTVYDPSLDGQLQVKWVWIRELLRSLKRTDQSWWKIGIKALKKSKGGWHSTKSGFTHDSFYSSQAMSRVAIELHDAGFLINNEYLIVIYGEQEGIYHHADGRSQNAVAQYGFIDIISIFVSLIGVIEVVTGITAKRVFEVEEEIAKRS